ncbi:MAG: hypothetical protein AAB368_16295, partial [bacterium]
MITYGVRYGADDLDVEGIRRRVLAVKSAWLKAWERVIGPACGAAVMAVEVSPAGYVHVHAVVPGWVDADALRGCIVHTIGEGGRVMRITPIKHSRNAAREVAKYLVKAPHYSAGPGRPTYRIHPDLAARVEVATARMHLIEGYGKWRGLVKQAKALEEHSNEHLEDVACLECGAVGLWITERFSIWEVDPRTLTGVCRDSSRWRARDGP